MVRFYFLSQWYYHDCKKLRLKYKGLYPLPLSFFTTFQKVQTHRTRFDNAVRFFDFHWPITLILHDLSFSICRSAITFWVIWSTYLLKFPFIGYFINFQRLKNRGALSNRVRCAYIARRLKTKKIAKKLGDYLDYLRCWIYIILENIYFLFCLTL
jgi:hypothetical protein